MRRGKRKIYLTTKGRYMLVLSVIFMLIQALSKYQNKRALKELAEKPEWKKTYMTKIIKVTDGDTAELMFINEIPEGCATTEKVRLIGIDAPELNINNDKPMEYYAKEAFKFTNKELLGEYVSFQFDKYSGKKDEYGRLVGYIWVDDFLFNQILVERGFARYYPALQFNPKYMKLFEAAENYARTNKIGMWDH